MREKMKDRINIYPTYIEIFDHNGIKTRREIPKSTIFTPTIDIHRLHEMGYKVYRHIFGIGLIES